MLPLLTPRKTPSAATLGAARHRQLQPLRRRPPLTAGRAEVREYLLRHLDRDAACGVNSDIIPASTTP